VPVGQVTDIGVDYVTADESFRMPVRYEIWPRQLHILGAAEDGDIRALLHELVEMQGLRARLESVSLVTGQYVVTLGLEPDAPPLSDPLPVKGPVRVPPMPATRDQVEELFQSIDLAGLVASATGTLQALEELLRAPELKLAINGLNGTLEGMQETLAQLNADLTPLLQGVERTLAEYRKLAETLDARVGPLATTLEERFSALSTEYAALARNLDARIGPLSDAATEALDEAGAAMRAVTDLAGEGSPARYELTQLLTEATRAARSLRGLADYLERHPESLIQGKR
jgi:paraquat-inducible protein B